MTTLGAMKTRIASDLRRSDLTSQIAAAIPDAIDAYSDRRFFFNEGRETSFPTVANTEFYTSEVALIETIDYVVLLVGSDVRRLTWTEPDAMEALSANGTQINTPWTYTFYGNKLRVYPVPDQAYTIRIGGVIKYAAPASDVEPDNAWMTTAARLIRARAKYDLALHVLRDTELAGEMASAVTEALEQLVVRTNQKTRAEGGCVRAMDF